MLYEVITPIVRKELREREAVAGEHVAVYLKPLYRDTLFPLLERLGKDRITSYNVCYTKLLRSTLWM